jgi:HSP20 family protein
MSLVRWNPMREMVSLREAMGRLFEESFVRPFGDWPVLGERWTAPAVNMFEDEDHVIIEAEVPGVKADDIEVAVQQGVLRISGEFKEEEEREGKSYHRRERRIGRFERALSLPSSVNPDAAKAEFKDGILTLTFDKLEQVKPKRIEIKVKK